MSSPTGLTWVFPFFRIQDSDLEDYDHEAAGERIGSMLQNLKRHPQIVGVFRICTMVNSSKRWRC